MLALIGNVSEDGAFLRARVAENLLACLAHGRGEVRWVRVLRLDLTLLRALPRVSQQTVLAHVRSICLLLVPVWHLAGVTTRLRLRRALQLERLRAHGRVLISRHLWVLCPTHLCTASSRADVARLQLRLNLVGRYLQVLTDGVLRARHGPVVPLRLVYVLLVAQVLNVALAWVARVVSLALRGRLERLSCVWILGLRESNIRFELRVVHASVMFPHRHLLAPLLLHPLGLDFFEVRSVGLNACVTRLDLRLLLFVVLLVSLLWLELELVGLRLHGSPLLRAVAPRRRVIDLLLRHFRLLPLAVVILLLELFLLLQLRFRFRVYDGHEL